MGPSRAIRRLAFQILFQLDAQGETAVEGVRESIESDLSAREQRLAFELASRAFADRARADAAMEALAPTWPAKRQPAVDRALLRLAHHEIVSGDPQPKIVVNDAIELAKEFSTDRSPAFVNALLDKVLKHARGEDAEDSRARGEDPLGETASGQDPTLLAADPENP